jgi:hypothetical protein
MSGFSFRWCLNEEDYTIVCEMMSGWGMAALHRRMLSENGIIVSKNGVDVCSGWLYQTDSKLAWIEWVVMNKKARKELRVGALDFLYETLFEQARKLGFEVIMSLAHTKSFENKLKNKNFKKECFTYTSILYKNLWV